MRKLFSVVQVHVQKVKENGYPDSSNSFNTLTNIFLNFNFSFYYTSAAKG